MSDTLYWEYEMYTTDVTTLGEPPNSGSPIVSHRRRLVGEWEEWIPTGEPAPHKPEAKEDVA